MSATGFSIEENSSSAMKVNSDFSERVVVDTNGLVWTPSPTEGVERRMLERDGGEEARATSIVRYSPRSTFPVHVHGGGEEFLVLQGVFADEHGTYPAGTYVRNPIGSSHTPFTKEGCTILVKLRQMTEPAEPRLVIDTSVGEWTPLSNDGRQFQQLYRNQVNGESVYLARMHPGAPPLGEHHPVGKELFVLAGTMDDEQGSYPAGTWMRWPMDSRHNPSSTQGCLLWVKHGHLTHVSPRG